MKNMEAFVGLCQRVVADYEAGLVDIHLAAEKILQQANQHSFEDEVHPMLYKVSDLSFDIAEDYRSDKDDKADWDIIVETIKNYIAGNWKPTCWILSAMYGEYSGGQLTHSYSVSVRRQNGETIIETASDELRNRLNKLVNKLNVEQTDERYLQNLARFAPANIGTYKLASVEVAEYLTESYYSTA
jgi:hypothetical protein